MRVESNDKCRNSKWPNSTRLGVSLERLWNVSIQISIENAYLLDSSDVPSDILNSNRILHGKAMTLTLYTRFIDQDSSVCGQTCTNENMKRRYSLLAYQRRPGICGRQALPPCELFEDPGVGELTSSRRRAPQHLCLGHRPKSLSMDHDIAWLNALQHKSLF